MSIPLVVRREVLQLTEGQTAVSVYPEHGSEVQWTWQVKDYTSTQGNAAGTAQFYLFDLGPFLAHHDVIKLLVLGCWRCCSRSLGVPHAGGAAAAAAGRVQHAGGCPHACMRACVPSPPAPDSAGPLPSQIPARRLPACLAGARG